MQYNTITGSGDSHTRCWPSWYQGGSCKTWTLPIPASETKSYTQTSSVSWRTPPEVGTSFNKIIRSGMIKMTPYQRGKVSTHDYIVSEPHEDWLGLGSACIETYAPSNRCAKTWFNGFTTMNSSYVKHFVYDDVASLPHYSEDSTSDDVETALKDVSSQAVDRLHSTWDALTELAEAPEAIFMMINILKKARSPLKAVKELRTRYERARRKGKTHLEVIDDLSSQWLQLRYGIMPLVYSVMDIIELLEQEGNEFKTARAFDSVSVPSSVPSVNSNGPYIYSVMSGSIDVRAVGKMRYGQESSRLRDQISINPFLTAWELVPFSFVIDWFINVGDVISSYTSALYSAAEQRRFCRSVRTRTSKSFYYYHDYEDTYYRHLGALVRAKETLSDGTVCSEKEVRPEHTWDESFSNVVDALIRRVDTDSYDRTTFNPSDVGLSWSPSLSWMRSLDAAAITLRTVLRAL